MSPQSNPPRWERHFESGAWLCVEPLTELKAMQQRVSPSEWQESLRFKSEHRRQEYLGWRALCREMIGAKLSDENIFSYSSQGAPQIEGSPWCIGVSHSRDCVAVVISRDRCAVDIEHRDRRYSSILSRYTSPQELELSQLDDLHAKLWCAKEAMYKFVGSDKAYVADFEVIRFSSSSATGRTRFWDSDIELQLFNYEDYYIALIV